MSIVKTKKESRLELTVRQERFVDEYLERVKIDTRVVGRERIKVYPLGEQGTYAAIGAYWGGETMNSAFGRQGVPGSFEGTFRNAIVHFTYGERGRGVKGFYNSYCVGDPGNPNNGYIIKLNRPSIGETGN